jgi:PAS domain S-box-containing protein
LEATTDGVWDWDIPSGHVYFSPQWARLLGYEPEEVPQRVEFFYTLLLPEDIPRIRQIMEDHFAGKTPDKQDEVQLRTKSGEYRWFNDRGKVVTRDAKGAPLRMVGTITDITERKKAKAALEESERELRLITNKVPGPVSRVDRSLKYLFVNDAYERIFSRPREQIIGHTMLEVLGDQLFNDVRENVEKVLSGEPISFETHFIDAQGLHHHALVHYVPDRNAQNEVMGFFIIAFNVTDLRQAEDAVRMSDAALKSISQGVIITDRNGQILSLNRAFSTITGYTAEETLHQNCELLSANFQDPVALSSLQEARRKGIEFSREVLDRRRDGSLFWNDLTLTPVRGANGSITHFISVIRDVTERRKLEEQFRRSHRMEAIGHLASGVAHDFNNILAAILGNAELAIHETLHSNTRLECLKEIVTACDRGKSMIQQILSFSRQSPQQQRVIRLAPIIQESINLLRVTLPSSVNIKVSLAQDAPEILADPTQIHQVLVNLCTNAWHALGDKPGSIDVQLDRWVVNEDMANHGINPGTRAFARITVRDTGEGMSPEVLEQIFDPFFTTKEQGKGTGLGLAVVMGIVQAHHGTISVESQVGKGSTFYIHLPASNSSAPKTPSTSIGTSRGSGQRVLFLDDEPGLVSLGTRMLRHLGYEVEGFEHPAEALNRFRQEPNRFDLVITDHNMPGQTGLQIASQIRSLSPSVPIVLCSGRISDDLLTQARDCGIQELLHKPASIQDYSGAVSRALTGDRQSTSTDSETPR